MKNLRLILTAATLFIFSYSEQIVAQNNCVKEGTIIIDAFYGYPYTVGVALKNTLGNVTEVHNTNHLGGKAEYMISDKIGLGIEATYADLSVKYTDSLNRPFDAGINKLRVLGKMNVHFATNAHLDPYFTVGAGIKRTNIYDNGPGGKSFNTNLIPVAMRVGVGIRYFFTDVVGLNAEIGLGGPIVQGGLSFKF